MKKFILFTSVFFIAQSKSIAQSKWDFGVTIFTNQCDNKLIEFTDPFPFYNNDFSNNAQTFYGTTTYFIGYGLGIFTNYDLLENGRLKLVFELNLNRRGYKQQDNSFNQFTITKNYLDIPLNIKIQPFYKAGVFIETGIYQAFILSKKTDFPYTNANSSEFEKRRARANTREVNLFGFNIGAGYEFKKFDVSANYRTDKQYNYIQLGAKFEMKSVFFKNKLHSY